MRTSSRLGSAAVQCNLLKVTASGLSNALCFDAETCNDNTTGDCANLCKGVPIDTGEITSGPALQGWHAPHFDGLTGISTDTKTTLIPQNCCCGRVAHVSWLGTSMLV